MIISYKKLIIINTHTRQQTEYNKKATKIVLRDIHPKDETSIMQINNQWKKKIRTQGKTE